MRVLLFIVWSFLVTSQTLAQFSLSLGYNAGRFTIPQRNFEILEYEYRNVMPGFKVPNFLYGASVGFRMEDDRNLVEFLFTNKRMSTANYTYTGSDGIDYDYKLKMQLRTFNMGYAFGSEVLKLGISMDVGRFRAFRRNGPSSEDTKWEKYYNMHTIYAGFTFFAPIRMGAIEIRPYYQMSWFVDKFFDGSDFTHRSNNVGINVSFVIQK